MNKRLLFLIIVGLCASVAFADSYITLYVGHLSVDVKETEVNAYFGQFGDVISAKLLVDRNTGLSKGYAFVEMFSKDSATTVIKKTNGTKLGSNTISVAKAIANEDADRSSEGAALPAASAFELMVVVNEKGIGNKEFGAAEFAGTKGQGRPIQDLSISFRNAVPNLGLQYKAHISNVGDTAAIKEGASFGYAGKQNVEGISIELTGTEAIKYNVFYSAHIANLGDSAVFKNGEFCGTRGKSLALEGITVWIERKN